MSDKIKTVVRIGGQEYRLSGYESEEYMHRVAIYVDRKMNEIGKNFTDLNTTMIAVLAALNIADELIRERSKHEPAQEPARIGQAGVQSSPSGEWGRSGQASCQSSPAGERGRVEKGPYQILRECTGGAKAPLFNERKIMNERTAF